MGDGMIVLAYLLAGIAFGAVAYRMADESSYAWDSFGIACATFCLWPIALAIMPIAYAWVLIRHHERLLIFSEEGRLRARARRARRDLRLLELRREAEEAEEKYRRSLDRMIEEASR